MAIATMTSKGQITVPAAVRARFGLRAGAKVDFAVNEAGELVLRPRTGDVRALRGMISWRGPAVSIEAMDEAIGAAVSEAFERSIS
ncbi:MAG TPA: AbrB/MazE/SpoVT family DNA-binding domain-containing protein [Caulobacteraceae bacterium]|nr:AbrB/MazE/SpoVT family DNA-binding domain-containing protein [Caulobacteraceae bacterium]